MKPILITGAGGKTGRAALTALHARGARVRAWVRRPDQVAALRDLGAHEVMVGDFPGPLAAAVADVAAVYHICPNMHPTELAMAHTLLAACRAASVPHVVYHSVLHPQAEAMPHHWQKLRAEELLFTADLAWTVLQPAPYMQNLLAYRAAVCARGVLPLPYGCHARISLVDLADVGEAAARVLTEPGHDAAIYELVGTPGLAQHEVAAALSAHLGRPIRCERTPWTPDPRLPPYAAATLAQMFAYYDAHGLPGNPQVLGWLLGRAPTPLVAFLQRAFICAEG